VEDNPGDVLLVQRALKDSKVANRLSVTHDGVAAMEFLHQEGRFSDACRPDLILLDLNLPGLKGVEVLARLKSDSDLRRIPVLILTTSDVEQDVVDSYNLHANCYLVKPVEIDGFDDLIRAIETFWMCHVKLPYC
jgi:CheY-like chemotaxis protein